MAEEIIKTVPHMLHHWATHQPDTAAFICVDSAMKRRLLTRADFYRLAARYAAILRRGDVRSGDVVCNTLPNSPERVVTDYGIMLAGATAMNGQIFLADGKDFIGTLRDSKCTAVILDPQQPKGAMFMLESLGKKELGGGRVQIQGLPALSTLFPCYWERQGQVSSLMEMLEEQQESYVADVSGDDLACIWTTSGSTGFSKLIPHTHSRLLRYSLAFCKCRGMLPVRDSSVSNSKERVGTSNQLKMTPSSHVRKSGAENTTCSNTANDQMAFSFLQGDISEHEEAKSSDGTTHYARHVFFNNSNLGWSGGFPAEVLALGATRVLVDQSRGSPSDLMTTSWTVIRQERCQYAFFLPFDLQQLLLRDDLWKDLPWRFKAVGLAGQPVHAHLVKNAIRKITESISVFYGSSELGPMTMKTVTDPDKYKDCNNGKPLPGVEIKVLEMSSADGKLGEIISRSDSTLLGYVNNEEATQNIRLPDGWYRTGDVGYSSDEGDLFIICRDSFSIMRGAYVIHPGWLEGRINSHPAVANVLVVPVPDPVLHQELCACVVMKPGTDVTAEELKEFCQSLFLTGSGDQITAVPRYFLFFPALPTNATGKPCRQTTIREARARLGL